MDKLKVSVKEQLKMYKLRAELFERIAKLNVLASQTNEMQGLVDTARQEYLVNLERVKKAFEKKNPGFTVNEVLDVIEKEPVNS